MEKERGRIRKTVVLHPLMNDYVQRTWSLLIESGHEVTYSVALNFMLLTAIREAIKEDGLSEETRVAIWNFIEDRETVKRRTLDEQLHRLREGYGMS